MKAIIEFTLPEEDAEYRICANARDMYSSLYHLSNYIRSLEKGWEEFELEKVTDKLNDILYESKYYDLE